MKKQTLYVNVTANKAEYYFIPKQERRNGKALKRVGLSVIEREVTNDTLTDFFSSYVDREAPRFTLRALKTIYANNWNEKIERLMKDCFNLWTDKAGLTTAEANALFQEDLASDEIVSYLPKSADSEIEKQYAKEHITSIAKEHTYTIRKDSDGRRHKVECIPYVTLEKTQYGKVIDREYKEVVVSDINDLVQVASLAMIELVRAGLVNSVFDMFNYRTYIYKAVNNYINKERAIVANEKPYIYTIDENGNENVMTEKAFVDRRLAKIERESVITELENVLVSSLDKRTNKENVLFTFHYVLIRGKSNTECAEVLKVDEKQVRRYISLISKALASKQTYTVLNELVNA